LGMLETPFPFSCVLMPAVCVRLHSHSSTLLTWVLVVFLVTPWKGSPCDPLLHIRISNHVGSQHLPPNWFSPPRACSLPCLEAFRFYLSVYPYDTCGPDDCGIPQPI
jgi:hypothetical protein